MDKIIQFKDLQEKKELTNLLNKLTKLINDEQYRKAFYIAYEVYDKYSFEEDFFMLFLTIVKELDFISMASTSDNLFKSVNGLTPFGTDFLDNDYNNSSNNDLKKILGDDILPYIDSQLPNNEIEELLDNESEDSFGYDKQLKDLSMSINEQYDDDESDETFIDIDFEIIYEKIMLTYDKIKPSYTITSFMTELITKNYINLKSDIHYCVLLKIKEAYKQYSDNISIAFDFLSAMMFCSLMQTVPKSKVPTILNDAYKIYLDFEYENFAEVYSCLLFNYIDNLNDKEKSKAMFIIKDIILDYDVDNERYLSLLNIIANKRFSQSGKRNYKNILKDIKEIALNIKHICNSFGTTYLIIINLFLKSHPNNVTLSWINREFEFIKNNFETRQEEIQKLYTKSLSILINIDTTYDNQLEIISLLKDIVRENNNSIVCHSNYGLGIANFIFDENNSDLLSFDTNLKNSKLIDDEEIETYTFVLAHASNFMCHREKKKAYNKIKEIKNNRPYNEKLEFAELIILKSILFDVRGDEFSAYLNLIESKLKDVDQMSFDLEVEYLFAIQELAQRSTGK